MQSKKHQVHNNGRQNGHARDRPSAHPSPSQVQMVSMRMREKNLLPLERGASNASWRQRASMVRSPFLFLAPSYI
ncbi:hypothetical protein M431DRAFT_285625 [Trichoderma harzianum CBS 226.95]|uniref:Uncharacterized protein n=1 Tax=Trichoderma harzianum CBS 226.95 TaxID=983964 RepID=A0A2T4ANX8_TRIHA|nr:hypothetical protein M431DRAFT_285625 [Trichoderma harzianum CBS 226.95]PTB58767.1 hypothetical protein M431DRAFT_285625 [Trichoderma harzianum CBS 226.95]